MTRRLSTLAEQHIDARAVWRKAAALLAPHRVPFHMRLRSECLVRAYGGPDAEIAMPDGRTRLLAQIGGVL